MNRKYVFPVSLLLAVTVVAGVYEAQYAHQGSTPSIQAQIIAPITSNEAPTSTTPPAKETASKPSATSASTPVAAPTTTGYSQSQVAQHASGTSCWTSISHNVYDLTQWINQHPGGSGPILGLCGHDGTTAFLAQHGGQGRPEQELKQFYIGVLN